MWNLIKTLYFYYFLFVVGRNSLWVDIYNVRNITKFNMKSNYDNMFTSFPVMCTFDDLYVVIYCREAVEGAL